MLYNLFQKWYNKTYQKLVPVQVECTFSYVCHIEKIAPVDESETSLKDQLCLAFDLRVSNGMHISQKNLSYQGT